MEWRELYEEIRLAQDVDRKLQLAGILNKNFPKRQLDRMGKAGAGIPPEYWMKSGQIQRFQTGGHIPGYGGGDRVPAMLEKGEFIVRKEVAREYLPELKKMNQGGIVYASNGRFLTGGDNYDRERNRRNSEWMVGGISHFMGQEMEYVGNSTPDSPRCDSRIERKRSESQVIIPQRLGKGTEDTSYVGTVQHSLPGLRWTNRPSLAVRPKYAMAGIYADDIPANVSSRIDKGLEEAAIILGISVEDLKNSIYQFRYNSTFAPRQLGLTTAMGGGKSLVELNPSAPKNLQVLTAIHEGAGHAPINAKANLTKGRGSRIFWPMVLDREWIRKKGQKGQAKDEQFNQVLEEAVSNVVAEVVPASDYQFKFYDRLDLKPHALQEASYQFAGFDEEKSGLSLPSMGLIQDMADEEGISAYDFYTAPDDPNARIYQKIREATDRRLPKQYQGLSGIDSQFTPNIKSFVAYKIANTLAHDAYINDNFEQLIEIANRGLLMHQDDARDQLQAMSGLKYKQQGGRVTPRYLASGDMIDAVRDSFAIADYSALSQIKNDIRQLGPDAVWESITPINIAGEEDYWTPALQQRNKKVNTRSMKGEQQIIRIIANVLSDIGVDPDIVRSRLSGAHVLYNTPQEILGDAWAQYLPLMGNPQVNIGQLSEIDNQALAKDVGHEIVHLVQDRTKLFKFKTGFGDFNIHEGTAVLFGELGRYGNLESKRRGNRTILNTKERLTTELEKYKAGHDPYQNRETDMPFSVFVMKDKLVGGYLAYDVSGAILKDLHDKIGNEQFLEWQQSLGNAKSWVDKYGEKPITEFMPRILGYAQGGKIPGYGGGDKIPALLEAGEYVVRKEVATRYTSFLESMNRGGIKGYASGGPVYAQSGADVRKIVDRRITWTIA